MEQYWLTKEELHKEVFGNTGDFCEVSHVGGLLEIHRVWNDEVFGMETELWEKVLLDPETWCVVCCTWSIGRNDAEYEARRNAEMASYIEREELDMTKKERGFTFDLTRHSEGGIIMKNNIFVKIFDNVKIFVKKAYNSFLNTINDICFFNDEEDIDIYSSDPIERLSQLCLAVGTAGFVGVDCPEEEAEIHEIYTQLIKEGYGVKELDELVRTAYGLGEDSYITNSNEDYISCAIYDVEDSFSRKNREIALNFDMQLFSEVENNHEGNFRVIYSWHELNQKQMPWSSKVAKSIAIFDDKGNGWFKVTKYPFDGQKKKGLSSVKITEDSYKRIKEVETNLNEYEDLFFRLKFEFDMQLFAGDVVEGDIPETIFQDSFQELSESAATTSAENKEENKMEKKMSTREEIQAGHDFAKQVINNSLDKRNIELQEISLGSKYNNLYATAKKTSCGMNDLTDRYYKNAPKSATFIDGNHVTVVNNTVTDRPFSDEIIKIDFRGIEDNNKAAHIAEAIRDNLLEIQYIGSTDAILWIKSRAYADVKYYEAIRIFGDTDITAVDGTSIFEGKRYVKFNSKSRAADITTIRNIEGSVFKTYGSHFVTDGGRRNDFDYFFKKNDNESIAEFKTRIREDLNNMSGGLLDTIEEMLKVRGGVSREKAFKLFARLSLAFTPMTKSVELTSFAFYNGTFGDSNCSDGQMTINGDKIAEYYNLKPEFVYGLGIQGRIINGIICKGMQISTAVENMSVVAYEGFKKRAYISFADFRAAWIANKLEDGILYMVNLIEDEIPDIIIDDNAMKAVVNETDTFTFRIVSVKDRTQGYLNSQTMHGMMHLDGAIDLFEEIGKANIDTEIAKIYELFDENCKPSKKVVNPDMYLADMIRGIAPHYVVTDRKLYEFLLKATANKIFKDIHEYHFTMSKDDFVGYIQNDYLEMLTGIRALEDNVMHVSGMEDGIEATLDRNPKTYQKENCLAVNSNLVKVFKNIDDGRCEGISKRLVKVAKEMYWYADTAIIVMPADPAVKNRLGGCDFDGDLATVRVLKKFVAIQKQEKPGMSIIPDAPESGIRVTEYTDDLMENMMIDGLFGQKDKNGKRIMSSTVGLASNHNSLIQDLAVADGKLLRRVLDKVVDPNCEKLGYKKTDKKYEQHIIGDNTEVKNADAENATVDFYNSDRSVKSFRIFLDDCKKMAPSVVGRVIDMAKTGEVVFAWYASVLAKRNINGKEIYGDKFLKCVCAEHVNKALGFTRNEDGVSTGVIIYNSEVKEDQFVIESPLSQLRDRLLAYFVEKINELFAKECAVSEFEQTMISEGIGTGYVNKADLYFAKSIHSMLSFSAGLDTDDKKYAMNVMAGFVRNLFDNRTDSFERFVMLKTVGNGSYFPQVLNEEYILGVNAVAKESGWNTCDLVGYRAYSMDNKGAISVEFQNGVSVDGSIVTDKRVNGIWNVCYEGSTLYIVRNIEEYFVPQFNNSCVVRFKDFDSAKKVSKYNQIPDIMNLEGGFICIENEDKNSAAIFSDNYRDQYQISVPRSEDKKSVLDTRYNNSIKNNGLKIGKVIQYADRTGKTITLALGSFVNRNGKALPKAKKVAKIQNYSNDVSNVFDAFSANIADFDVITK